MSVPKRIIVLSNRSDPKAGPDIQAAVSSRLAEREMEATEAYRLVDHATTSRLRSSRLARYWVVGIRRTPGLESMPPPLEVLSEDVRKLATGDLIEESYIEEGIVGWRAGPGLESVPAPIDGRQQHHLERYPTGVSAVDAWPLLGGKGEGVGLIVIDARCHLDHVEIGTSRVGTVPGFENPPFPDEIDQRCRFYLRHGTRAMGTVIAVPHPDRKNGTRGIAPDAFAPKFASWLSKDDPEGDRRDSVVLARAIAASIIDLIDPSDGIRRPGVVLVEAHTERSGKAMPIEVQPHLRDLLICATENDVVVVEPAGNGDRTLDDEPLLSFDSGAIMVGAAVPDASGTQPTPWVLAPGSNSGRRVDCYAPSNNLLTSDVLLERDGTISDYASESFTHTSAASAVVAGICVSLLGIHAARDGSARLKPLALRDMLRRPGGPIDIVDMAQIIGRHFT